MTILRKLRNKKLVIHHQNMSSPIIKKEKIEMSFYEALKKLVEGSKITRLDWNNESIYGFLFNGEVCIHNEDGDHRWIINDGDVLATDWIELLIN